MSERAQNGKCAQLDGESQITIATLVCLRRLSRDDKCYSFRRAPIWMTTRNAIQTTHTYVNDGIQIYRALVSNN